MPLTPPLLAFWHAPDGEARPRAPRGRRARGALASRRRRRRACGDAADERRDQDDERDVPPRGDARRAVSGGTRAEAGECRRQQEEEAGGVADRGHAGRRAVELVVAARRSHGPAWDGSGERVCARAHRRVRGLDAVVRRARRGWLLMTRDAVQQRAAVGRRRACPGSSICAVSWSARCALGVAHLGWLSSLHISFSSLQMSSGLGSSAGWQLVELCRQNFDFNWVVEDVPVDHDARRWLGAARAGTGEIGSRSWPVCYNERSAFSARALQEEGVHATTGHERQLLRLRLRLRLYSRTDTCHTPR